MDRGSETQLWMTIATIDPRKIFIMAVGPTLYKYNTNVLRLLGCDLFIYSIDLYLFVPGISPDHRQVDHGHGDVTGV